MGAIKRRRPNYASTIAVKSEFEFNNNIHELGYVAVKNTYQRRGFSHEIIRTLISGLGGSSAFATTSHEGMKCVLTSAGFVQKGKEWIGSRGKLLSLWIRA